MKATIRTTLTAVIILTAGGGVQAGVPVIDYTHIITSTVNQTINYVEYAQEVINTYTQIENQVEELKRLGDAATIFDLAGVDGLYEDLMKEQTVLSDFELDAMLAEVNGGEILGSDLNGLFDEIGTEFTVSGGGTVGRDEVLYKPEAAMHAQVEEYRRSKEEINERRRELKSEISGAMTELQGASTDAEVQKQSAVVGALQGELASVESESVQAEADMGALEMEVAAQERARQKATAEKDAADLERAMQRDQELYKLDNSKMRWGSSE